MHDVDAALGLKEPAGQSDRGACMMACMIAAHGQRMRAEALRESGNRSRTRVGP